MRVGSLRGLLFVIHITKSVKQSVQIDVVSEFAICFSELDRIFGRYRQALFSGARGYSGVWKVMNLYAE